MAPNELRVGNYIKSDDDVICIVSRIETKDYTNWNSGDDFSITALEINTNDDYLNVRFDKWKPIPLTEEILLKCGWGWNNKCNSFENDKTDCRFYITKQNNINGKRKVFNYVLKAYIANISYLHQLQNLYWCLCGKELIVNL